MAIVKLKSLLWRPKWFKEVMAAIGDEKNKPLPCKLGASPPCMHGGRRPEKTSFLYGGAVDLSTLETECNHSPEELLPWGLANENGLAFATATA